MAAVYERRNTGKEHRTRRKEGTNNKDPSSKKEGD